MKSANETPAQELQNGLQIDHCKEILYKLPVGVYTCNAEGYIELYNEAAVQLWGRTPEAGKEKWCGSWKMYNTDGTLLPHDECPMAMAIKEGRTVRNEIIVEQPDGTRYSVIPHTQPLRDSNGKITGAVNTVINITHLAEARKKIEESEKRYNMMMMQSPFAFAILKGKDMVVTLANDSIKEIWGKGKDVEGKLLLEVLPEIKDQPFPGLLDKVYTTGTPYLTSEILAHLQHNGKMQDMYFNLVYQPFREADESISGVTVIAVEVTGNVEARQKLEESEKRYRELYLSLEEKVRNRTEMLRNMNKELKQTSETLMQSEERYHRMVSEVQDYAILYLNRDGIIGNWNEGAEKIKGYKAEEIIGKNFSIFYLEPDRKNKLPQKLLTEALKNGKANHEGWRVRKNGSVFWGNTVITALHDKEKNVIGFSKVTRDLTDKKAAEENLIKANEELLQKNEELQDKNKQLESFVHISSHDLQEPLRKIQTFANILFEKEHESLSDGGKDYLLRMQNSAHRMRTLIQDLLTFSYLSAAERKFENYDLKKIVEEAREELKAEMEEKQATIEVRTAGEVSIIPFQFRQLLQNLISNALKFSNPKVPLRVTIENGIITSGKVNGTKLLANKDYHHIRVSDNGIGFEKKYSEKIFEVFQKLHNRDEYAGTGMGLAIVKKIVENHNGIINATAELNKGASFDIYIPAK